MRLSSLPPDRLRPFMLLIRENSSREKKLLAVLTGLLLTALFPPADLSWLAWISLLPLFIGLEGTTPFQALKLGLLAGMAHFLSLIYWIVFVLDHYGNLGVIPSLGPYLLFSFYLSLFIAVFCWGTVKMVRSLPFPWFFAAGLWVSLEYAKAHVLSGFPWCLLGYSQYAHLQIIQVADITGVYGISFLIVLTNGLIYSLLFRPLENPRPLFRLQLFSGIGLLIAAILYGGFQKSAQNNQERDHRVTCAIIQPNVDQSIKWNPTYQAQTMAVYERLTLAASPARPQLIVWPETALPFFFQDQSDLSAVVQSLATHLHADILFGSPAYQRKTGGFVYFNRAYLLSPAGNIDYYDKVHLVPFGEYVPFKRLLFFVDRLVASAGDFASGKQIAPLKDKNLMVGPLICFEAIFPTLAREQVKKGAQVLVNLTNDAWFGSTSAPYQHLAMAVFRAVENRRPFIRAANTGFSAFITTTGEITSRSTLFMEQRLIGDFYPTSSPLTFYTRFGDIFSLFLSAVSLFGLLWCTLRKTSS